MSDVKKNILYSQGFLFHHTGTNLIQQPGLENFTATQEMMARRFVCNICGASYRQCTNLSAHKKRHLGETQCQLCNKVYSRKSHMTRHMISVHGVGVQGKC